MPKINEAIRYPEIRLIDQDNEQLGIVTINEAMRLARVAGLDLVEVTEKAKPPVCKIVDFNKFRYDQAKKEKELKKKQRASQVTTKEIWLRPSTGENDIKVKLKRTNEFLAKGDRVKFGIKFRGREIANFADTKLHFEEISNSVDGDILQPMQKQGHSLVMIFGPRRKQNEET